MINKQKSNAKKTFKKPSMIKQQKQGNKENNVNVVKHFQPNISHSHQYITLNAKFPEIDCEIDNQEWSQNKQIKLSRMLKPPAKKRCAELKLAECPEKLSQPHITEIKTVLKNNLDSRKYPKKSWNEICSKFSSSAECDSEKCEPKFKSSVRSKSLVTNRKHCFGTNKVADPHNLIEEHRSNNFLSMTDPFLLEAHAKDLKSEIQKNITNSVNFKSKVCIKPYSQMLSVLDGDSKVEGIHDEISCVKKQNVVNKRMLITELKSEIAEYKRSNTYQVYSLFDEREDEHKNKKNIESAPTITNKSFETIFERRGKEVFQDEDDSLKEELSQWIHLNIENTIASDERTEQEPIKMETLTAPRRSQIFYSDTDSQEESVIKSKIEEANILISRVKDALHAIKNIKTQESVESMPQKETDFACLEGTIQALKKDANMLLTPEGQESDTDELEIKESSSLNYERPKTRRCEYEDEMSEEQVLDKFNTCPIVQQVCEDFIVFDPLQSTLNTINETTENESTSTEEVQVVSETEDVKKASGQLSSTYNVSVPSAASKNVQVKPDSKESETQTFAQESKKCLTMQCQGVQAVGTGLLDKTSKLRIQIMPSINIRGELRVQPGLNFSIDNEGITTYRQETLASNIHFEEVAEGGAKTLQLKKFNKGIFERLLNKSESEIKRERSRLTSPKYIKAVDKRCFSDTDLQANKKHSSQSQPEEEDVKDIIFQSYNLRDNINDHDPGSLSSFSLEKLAIDTDVYRTFINPAKRSTSSIKDEKAEFLLPRVSTKKYLSEKDITKIRYYGKVWDLYSSKSVQCNASMFLPLSRKQSKVVQEEPVSPRLDDTHDSHDTAKSTSENSDTITITVSYSTDETIKSDSLTASKDISTKDEKDVEQTEEFIKDIDLQVSDMYETMVGSNLYNCRNFLNSSVPVINDTRSEVSKEPSLHTADDTDKGLSRAKIELGSSKNYNVINKIKDKLKSLDVEASNPVLRMTRDSSEETVSTFIRGLTRVTYTNVDAKKKLECLPDKQLKPDESNTRILHMHVEGDCPPDINKDFQHLELGANGRYKDEENLFFQRRHPKYEDLKFRKRSYQCMPKIYQRRYNLDSTNSDTITAESLSDGEIKCTHTVSNGEIHSCKNFKKMPESRKRLPFKKFTLDHHNLEIEKRRTHFNNWVTYYVWKNKKNLNDSTSTSSSNK